MTQNYTIPLFHLPNQRPTVNRRNFEMMVPHSVCIDIGFRMPAMLPLLLVIYLNLYLKKKQKGFKIHAFFNRNLRCILTTTHLLIHDDRHLLCFELDTNLSRIPTSQNVHMNAETNEFQPVFRSFCLTQSNKNAHKSLYFFLFNLTQHQ